MIKFYVTRTQYHRVGHIFITFIYSLSAIRYILLKYVTTYLIAFTFSGLSENASHICRNPASVSYTSVVSAVFAVARCPSVTLVDFIQTAEDILKLLSRFGNPIILVFIPSASAQFQGEPFTRVAKYTGV